MSSKNACPIVYYKFGQSAGCPSCTNRYVTNHARHSGSRSFRNLHTGSSFLSNTSCDLPGCSFLRLFGFIVVIDGLLTPFVGTRLLTSFSVGENTTVLEQQHHANIGHALSVAGLSAAQSLSGSDSPSVDGSD